MSINKGVKLRLAVSILILSTVLSSIIINLVTATNAFQSTLTNTYLENNYKYANKLSINTNTLLTHMQNTINGMATSLGHKTVSQQHLDERRWELSDYFNSIFIVDVDSVIQLISPAEVDFKNHVQAGNKIETEAVKKALSLKKPFISEPHIASSGRLAIIISAPIFDENKKYKGLVAGTIYLDKGDNAFKHLLDEDIYEDGSYTYVVDNSGHVIYHPNSNVIRKDLSEHKIVQQIMQGKSGKAQIKDLNGETFFAGYAYEKHLKWGIISQTPTTVIEEPISTLLKQTLLQSLPVLLIILLIAHSLTNNLVGPLNKLAKISEDAIRGKKDIIPLNKFIIKSRIYEINQLYQQIYRYFVLLNNQIQLDGLTGLANRRTFDQTIQELLNNKIPFSLIMIDIDHFKKVNDTYGHLIGDDALKFIANIMQSISGNEDLCFRYGGEEFSILLKNKSESAAWKTAEKLRKKIAETISPTGECITISLGISMSSLSRQSPEEIIKNADCALFKSKATGRNKTTIYDETCDHLLS